MKKLIKKNIVATLVGACALCSTFAFVNVVNASANTQVTIDTLSTFEMMDGATVRLVDGDPGIRFSATMSVDEYQGLVQTYGKQNVEFGTFIMAASYESMVSSITDPNVYFGGNPTFGWKLEDGTSVGGATQILQMDSGVYEYTNAQTQETVMRVNGSVSKVLPANLMREFVGVSYVKVTTEVNGQPTAKYKMATLQEDRARTIVYVVQKAADAPENAASKTVLEDFVADYVNTYKQQNGGVAPTANYNVEVYDHGKYVETLTCEGELNEAVTYAVPSENAQYLDEENSVLSTNRVLANGKTTLKVAYNKTHTPVTGSYNKGVNPSWTCACGHVENTTAAEYRKAVNDIYAFNSAFAKDLLTFDGAAADTALNDVVYVDGKLTNVKLDTTKDYSAATINIGGFYKVEDITSVTVNITVDEPQTNTWLDAYLNHAAAIGDNGKTTRPATSGSSYKTHNITNTGAASIVIEMSNVLLDTNFTKDTVLNTLTLGFASNLKKGIISIDSIQFLTEADVLAALNEQLKFNSAADSSLLWTGNGSVAVTTDGNGNSVAAISYSGYGGANTNANSNSNTVRISMGGTYKLGQVAEIKIKVKQNTSAGTSTVMNSNIWINRDKLTYDKSNTGNITNGYVKQFNAGNLSATEYSTVSITYDNISAKYATNGLTDETLLETIAFGFTASGDRLAYLHIDSIEIVLK